MFRTGLHTSMNVAQTNALLQNKNALVVGGTGGIGRGIVTALSDQGCCVVATGISEQELQNSHAELPASVDTVVMDVTEVESIDDVLKGIDRLDILINCAGIILRDQREFNVDGFTEVLNVNLIGTMRMCTACHAKLAESGGCVVNIASMLSFFGSATVPAYSSSKGGVAQLTKSLAIAWAPEGIRVNAIAPGWIETELTAPLVADREKSRRLMERTPMARWGSAEDIGGAAVFLCSRWAKFVTGVVLPVDGGYSIC